MVCIFRDLHMVVSEDALLSNRQFVLSKDIEAFMFVGDVGFSSYVCRGKYLLPGSNLFFPILQALTTTFWVLNTEFTDGC